MRKITQLLIPRSSFRASSRDAAANRGLTDDDLKAVCAYLCILKLAKHRVDNTEPPAYCKLGRGKHGAGDQT